MFGCTDGTQVLKEVAACRKAFPDAYIRWGGRRILPAGLDACCRAGPCLLLLACFFFFFFLFLVPSTPRKQPPSF